MKKILGLMIIISSFVIGSGNAQTINQSNTVWNPNLKDVLGKPYGVPQLDKNKNITNNIVGDVTNSKITLDSVTNNLLGDELKDRGISLKDYGAKMNGTPSDMAPITKMYTDTQANGKIIFPCNGKWPNDNSGNRWTGPHQPGKSVYWDLTCNANWATNVGWGTQIDNALGENDITEANVSGSKWIMRKNNIEDNGQPVLLLKGQYGTLTNCFWPGGVTCNEPLFQSYATITKDSNQSVEAGVFQVDDYSNHPWGSQPQGLMIHMNKYGTSSSWAFAFELNDYSMLPPQSFSQTNEIDEQANGWEPSEAHYDPQKGTRKLLYFGSGTHKWKDDVSYYYNTQYNVGDKVAVGDVNGEVSIFEAQTSGKSGSSIVPTWPHNIGDTVVESQGDKIIWKKINSYYNDVAAGIWFNLDPGATQSYYENMIAGNAYYRDAAINLSEMRTDVGNSAAIRLAANQAIDFSGNLTESGKNQRILTYSTWMGNNALTYNVLGKDAFKVKDNGEVYIPQRLNIGGDCSTTGAFSNGLSFCQNAHAVNDNDIIYKDTQSVHFTVLNTTDNSLGKVSLAIGSNDLRVLVPATFDNDIIRTDGNGNLTTTQSMNAGSFNSTYDVNVGGNLNVTSRATFKGGCNDLTSIKSGITFCANAHSVSENDILYNTSVQFAPINSDGTVGDSPLSIDATGVRFLKEISLDNGNIYTDGKGNLTSTQIITAGSLTSTYNTSVGGDLYVAHYLNVSGDCSSGNLKTTGLTVCSNGLQTGEMDLLYPYNTSLDIMGLNSNGEVGNVAALSISDGLVTVGKSFKSDNGSLTTDGNGNMLLTSVSLNGSFNVGGTISFDRDQTTKRSLWVMAQNGGATTDGSNKNSDFIINRYGDTSNGPGQAYLGTPLSIDRDTGLVHINEGLSMDSDITVKGKFIATANFSINSDCSWGYSKSGLSFCNNAQGRGELDAMIQAGSSLSIFNLQDDGSTGGTYAINISNSQIDIQSPLNLDNGLTQNGYTTYTRNPTTKSTLWIIGASPSNASTDNSNTGGDFIFNRYSDDSQGNGGGYIDQAMSITRSTGMVNMYDGASIGSVKISNTIKSTPGAYINGDNNIMTLYTNTNASYVDQTDANASMIAVFTALQASGNSYPTGNWNGWTNDGHVMELYSNGKVKIFGETDINSTLYVSGKSTFDNGAIITDGSGNFTSSQIITGGVLSSAYDTKVGGDAYISHSIRLTGATEDNIKSTSNPQEGQIMQDSDAHLLVVYENGSWYKIPLGDKI